MEIGDDNIFSKFHIRETYLHSLIFDCCEIEVSIKFWKKIANNHEALYNSNLSDYIN